MAEESCFGAGTEVDPFRLFQAWFEEAVAAAPAFAEAAALATATREGRPSVRYVLFKGVREGGLLFFTNFESRKAREIAENPRAALAFHWEALRRQVRVEGATLAASPAEADAYFETRPRESQLGAWASPQSAPIESRAALDARFEEAARRFEGRAVPRPAFWGGYRLVPHAFEFWIHRGARLHDRFLYRRVGEAWETARLAP